MDNKVNQVGEKSHTKSIRVIEGRRGPGAAVAASASVSDSNGGVVVPAAGVSRVPVQSSIIPGRYVKVYSEDGMVYRFAVGGASRARQVDIIAQLRVDYQAAAMVDQAGGRVTAGLLEDVKGLGADWVEVPAGVVLRMAQNVAGGGR